MRLMSATVVALLLSAGCHPGPVIDTGPEPPGVGGTIAGMVRASDGATPLSARTVTAINSATGARFDVSTATNGGYTLKVPTGTYRLELELRGGERINTQPEPTEVNAGDLDSDRDFVVAPR